MSRKSSVWLIVLISIVAIAFIATGCSKRQVVKQEEAIPMAKAEAAPEKPGPEAYAKDIEGEAVAEAPAPKEEAVTEEEKAAPEEEVAKEEAPAEAPAPAPENKAP